MTLKARISKIEAYLSQGVYLHRILEGITDPQLRKLLITSLPQDEPISVERLFNVLPFSFGQEVIREIRDKLSL